MSLQGKNKIAARSETIRPNLSKIISLTRVLWIRESVIYLTGLFVFALILLNRSPTFLRPLSMNLRFGFSLIVPFLFLVLLLCFHVSGWQGKLLSFVATLSLFGLALAGVWASGYTQSISISGLLPLYDAQAYYIDALRLLAGRSIMEFSAARPLFTDLLATLLAITGRNLMMVLAILAAVNALTCYMAAQEIQRTHGSLAAVFLLILLFLYYRYRTISTVMSENLGFPLGVLGVTLIWRGIADRSYRLVLYGLLVSTVALNARPGPFLILPAMLLWGSWYFRDPGRYFSWRFFCLGGAAIFMGFALNFVVIRLIGTTSSVPFSRFSNALYGLASGGNSWSYVFTVHPELLELSEPEKTQTIYNLSFELISHHPQLLLQGAIHNWSVLFSNSWYSMFSFVSGENSAINLLTHIVLYILCLFGLLKWAQNRAEPYTSFVTAAAVGILLSVPFVPPADSTGMRLYAASIMIFGLLPALGLTFAFENLKVPVLQEPVLRTADSSAIGLSALLIFLLLIGPLTVRGTSSLSHTTAPSCQLGSDSVVILLSPGAYIHLIKEKELGLDQLPVFRQGLFKRNAHGLIDNNLIEWLEDLAPSTTLLNTLDYQSNKAILVSLPTAILPTPGSRAELCGRWEADPGLKEYNIFIADQAKATDP